MELNPQNILLIRLKSMGDVLFTLPAAHLVRENFPQSRISFLVSKEHAPLLAGFRDLDAVITLDRAVFRLGRLKAMWNQSIAIWRQLRQGRFSLAVDFQGYGETALLARCSGAEQRWGSLYGRGRSWAYTCTVRRNDRMHPSEWYLSLLQQCGLHPGKILNQFVLPEETLGDARRHFLTLGLNPDRPTLFIQPFTSTPHKNWPLERYLAVAAHWRGQGMQVLFAAGPNQRAALEPARQAGFPISFGPLLLDAGLVKLSTLVLGSDTGLLHLAVASGKRVVMIMTSALPGRCCPFQHPDWAITPLHGHGRPIAEIETGQVIEACALALSDLKLQI